MNVPFIFTLTIFVIRWESNPEATNLGLSNHLALRSPNHLNNLIYQYVKELLFLLINVNINKIFDP